MSISSSITMIVNAEYNIASLVRYRINFLSGQNRPVDFKKPRSFLLFKPDNILMKTLEATTQLGGLNQHLKMRHSKKWFP